MRQGNDGGLPCGLFGEDLDNVLCVDEHRLTFAEEKMMCRSLGAPNSLTSLKEYLVPLERRTLNG
jgi:hypothetical protein